MDRIKLSQMKKALVAIIVLVIVLLASFSYDTAHAYPVPELPEDNLIVNPWFRNLSDLREAGFDGWVRPLNEGVTWGPSQKESNPSPDLVISGTCGFEQVYCGTAARWAEQAGILYPYVDVYTYQVVAADPSHRKLKFFSYYVSHIVEVGAISIYGGESSEGPWQLLWIPVYHTEDELIVPESGEIRDLWYETGFLEWTSEQGYPYYKVELHARLPESPIPNGIRGIGFKVTGVYFSTAFTDEPGQPPPPPGGSDQQPDATATANVPTAEPGAATAVVTETVTPTTGPPGATPESASTSETGPAAAATETNEQEVPTLTAQALSPTEIQLAWNGGQNNRRGFRVDRSLSMTSGWRPIATLDPGALEFTDRGLPPDTVHYYRLRASGDQVSNVVSTKTLPQPQAPLVAPTALRAISTSPQEVQLQWRDLSENEEGFQVERGLDGLNFEPIATVEQNASSFTDSALVAGAYYYRLRSYGGGAFSDYSEVVSVEVGDRVRQDDGEVAAVSEPQETVVPQTTEQQGATTPSGQNSLIIAGLTILTLIIGIGLGVVLTRRRT